MKVINKSAFLVLAVLALALSSCVSSCSSTVPFLKSSVVPAAEIKTTVDQDKNNNYLIKIKVENLAQPQDLTPSKSNYTAWVECREGNFNLGSLTISKKLDGALSATTPYKPVRIKITSEDNPGAIYPGSQQVLVSEEIKIN